MRRFRRHDDQPDRADPADAKDLVDLAARMGIPPDDAARQVAQLISDANHAYNDGARASVGRGT
jgi:hypothetical protein